MPRVAAPTNISMVKNLKSDIANFGAIIDDSDLIGHLRRNEAIHAPAAIMNTGDLRDKL
jgi:hypothetical protein